ncbi:MAG: galactokinase [Myxococcaceae bacterium]
MTSSLERRLSFFFPGAPEASASAPGRVNLMGEHTDYNGGFVLPMAIPQKTHVWLRRLSERRVEVFSENAPARPGVHRYLLGAECRGGSWLDYAQGVTAQLAAAGHRLEGFAAHIRSDVPLGSGLSSSASLTVALLRALRTLFGLSLNDVALPLLAQHIENEFVGAPVGIMDPMAVHLADDAAALFLDTRTLMFERIPFPDGADLCVINSGLAHRHADGDYKTRRAECEQAATLLGVPQLRDVSQDALRALDVLPEPLIRRARHVITENARVLATVQALKAARWSEIGTLFRASHVSMRDDYCVSIPEIDTLVDLANTHPDVWGARLTGGGFGGSIVLLTKSGTARRVGQTIIESYGTKTGQKATLLVPA